MDRARGAWWVAIVMLAWSRIAAATSYAPPAQQDVWSPNHAFVLHVDPHAGLHTISRAGAPTPVWSFHRGIGFETFFLADDGSSVAVVAWQFVQVDELDGRAIELWTPSGLRASHSYEALVARPARLHGSGPVGSFWRRWLASASSDGRRVFVTTTGPYRYQLDLATGDIDREITAYGVVVWLCGVLAGLLGVVLGVRTARARRRAEYASDRRRLVWSAAAPIGALVWIWLELAGVVYVPAAAVADIELAVLVATLLVTPSSVIAARRLPNGTVRLLLAIALPVAVLALRFW